MDAAPKAKMQCCGNYEVFTWVPWISGLHVPQTPLFYIWLAHCGHTWDSRLFWGTQACYWGLWWSILDTCFAEHSHPPVTGIYNIINTNKLWVEGGVGRGGCTQSAIWAAIKDDEGWWIPGNQFVPDFMSCYNTASDEAKSLSITHCFFTF